MNKKSLLERSMNRWCLFVMILSLCGLSALAQSEKIMVQEGRTWNCLLTYPGNPSGSDDYSVDEHGNYMVSQSFLVAGDTVIAGIPYKKFLCNSAYYGALRQEGQTVYYVQRESEDEMVLYNYGLNVDDKFRLPGELTDVSVTAVETIEVQGVSYRRLTLCDAYGQFADFWVEGIGSTDGPIGPSVHGQMTPSRKMEACFQGDVPLFSYTDFFVSAAIKSHLHSIPSSTSAINYNLRGHRLTGKPSKGVYIEDGRKIVGK